MTTEWERFGVDLVNSVLAFLLVGGLGLTWTLTNYAHGITTDDAKNNRAWLTIIMCLHSFLVGHALVNLAQYLATNARQD